MAKRNSTKTATKEALSASQPVIQIFNKWQGINMQNKPVDWLPWDGKPIRDDEQTDMLFQFNAIQNNIELTENSTLETRQEILLMLPPPEGLPLSRAFKMIGGDAYVASGSRMFRWNFDSKSYTEIILFDGDTGVATDGIISEIERFGQTIIALTENGECFTGLIGDTTIYSASYINTPPDLTMSNFTGVGVDFSTTLNNSHPYRIGFQYVYSNKFGTTVASDKIMFYTSIDALYFGYDKYIKISQTLPAAYQNKGIAEVDIYLIKDDALLSTYYGSAGMSADGTSWEFFFRGTVNDTAGFTTHQSITPTINTTKGPQAKYMIVYDGRAFYWGGDSTSIYKNRIWIGGNGERPLSIAHGAGGRFVDIEPGLESWATNVLKFKTYNGATIITSLFGHENAYGRQRYNILEINIATSNEVSQQDYMYEHVSNVVGCNSRYGSDVFEDGLYVIDRYGLAVTTQAMESSNQLRVVYASENINSVFNELIGYGVNEASMVCVDTRVFLCLNKQNENGDTTWLDNVILVYDITLKSWYTFTMPDDIVPRRLVKIDYQGDVEGVGIITDTGLYRLPTTFPPDKTKPSFNVLLQSGEIGVRSPLQQWFYLRQEVLKFDYIIGDCTVTLNGVDIYGRHFVVTKNISVPTLQRNWTEWIMVEKYILSYNIRIEGQCRFRLTEIQNKTYSAGKKAEIQYGFDDRTMYYGRNGEEIDDHHYLNSYNNLREAIIT